MQKKLKKNNFFCCKSQKSSTFAKFNSQNITLKNYKEMKKVMFLLAVAGMFAFAACNSAAPAEEPADTTQQVVEETATEEAAQATDAEAEATEGVAEENAETQEAAK
ncbi:MAG: hypothetical protein IK032_05815 [Bacteroidales bacterium]|nr:hypothetical protein [Bacteroidales bacterium]